MRIFLAIQTNEHGRQSNGRNSMILTGSDEADIRASYPIPSGWVVTALDVALDGIDGLVVEGKVILPGRPGRGGDPIPAIKRTA